MRRLVLDGPGATRWDDVTDPVLTGPDSALVRPIAVATCDLDVAVLRGGYPVPGPPYAFGHEGVGVVVDVGADVATVAVGDTVVIPFQISCGRCAPCLRGNTGNCAAHPLMSTYGLGAMGGKDWGGLLADTVVVPHADAMLVELPLGVDPVVAASCSDNMPDAWRAVAPHIADATELLVVGGDPGARSIGLYAVAFAVRLGVPRVVYHDHDQARLDIAAKLGAECLDGVPNRKVGAFPVTVDASGTPDGLRCTLNSTGPDGVCTGVALYPDDPALPLLRMYSRCCTFHTGRAHVRPAIPRILDLLADGFDPTPVTSAVVPWDDAVAALADPPLKLVLSRA